MQRNSILLISLIMLITIILTGCFQGEQSLKEMDAPPQDAEAVDQQEGVSEDEREEDEEVADENEQSGEQETVARQLYLVDSNGLIVAQTLELPTPESKEVAVQVLEYLIKEGPVTPILPNGFQAVLPEGTEVLGLNLQEDGTLIVDVSEEFENYESAEELNIIESLTFTLTQFENIDNIKLWINGYPQDAMPINGTPIGSGYSRSNGINMIQTDTVDLLNSQAVTMYYPAEHNANRYFVPVTQYVETSNEELFSSIVESLIDGPGYLMNTVHVFNTNTFLRNSPKLEGGVLELVFSEGILKDVDQAIISDEVMETLVRTLTEQQAVKAVDVKVENIKKIVNENGEAYNEPVTNGTFMPIEKM